MPRATVSDQLIRAGDQLAAIPALDHQVLEDAAWPSTAARDLYAYSGSTTGAGGSPTLSYATARDEDGDVVHLTTSHRTAGRKLQEADRHLASALRAMGRGYVTAATMADHETRTTNRVSTHRNDCAACDLGTHDLPVAGACKQLLAGVVLAFHCVEVRDPGVAVTDLLSKACKAINVAHQALTGRGHTTTRRKPAAVAAPARNVA